MAERLPFRLQTSDLSYQPSECSFIMFTCFFRGLTFQTECTNCNFRLFSMIFRVCIWVTIGNYRIPGSAVIFHDDLSIFSQIDIFSSCIMNLPNMPCKIFFSFRRVRKINIGKFTELIWKIINEYFSVNQIETVEIRHYGDL